MTEEGFELPIPQAQQEAVYTTAPPLRHVEKDKCNTNKPDIGNSLSRV